MVSSDNIIQINRETAIDICKSVAGRVKSRRLEMNLTQEGLAARAGVNLATFRKFERTGEISLQNLTKLAFVLDANADFKVLFSQRHIRVWTSCWDRKIRTERGGREYSRKLVVGIVSSGE